MTDENGQPVGQNLVDLEGGLTAIKREDGTNVRHHQIAKRAAKKFVVTKKQKKYTPKMEYENKLRCIAYEREANSSTVADIPIHKAASKHPIAPKSTQVKWSVGSYVRVSQAGRSEGGQGYITGVSKVGRATLYSVKYDGDFCSSRKEDKIPVCRITHTAIPIHLSQLEIRATRARQGTEAPQAPMPPPTLPPKGKYRCFVTELADSVKQKQKKGWRKLGLGFQGTGKGDKTFLAALCADYRELKTHLQTTKELSGQSPNETNVKSDTPPALSVTNLAFAWGVSKNRPRLAYKELVEQDGKSTYLLKEQIKAAANDISAIHRGWKSVIDCRESARSYYTPKRMFMLDRIEKYCNRGESSSRQERAEKEKSLDSVWNKLPKHERDKWESEARAHDEEWPQIKNRIIVSLQRYGSKSFHQVSADIGGWCTHGTIWKWLKQYASYHIYAERIIPLVSDQQRRKQWMFAIHLVNHWDYPKDHLRKILWVHYDEKWFHGLVTRNNSKMCEELGLGRQDMVCYHRNYVNKVMIIAFTGYAFEGSIENGGHGVKLGLIRVQAAKIAGRLQREGRRDEYGAMVFDGKVVRNKGDVFMTDVTVTGSDSGTSHNPKFSLLQLFHDVIMPNLKKLTGPGGAYEGYTPVIQGDNAGPHQNNKFEDWVKTYCQRNEWHYEPQAPQMPYVNNLDLSVFPMMSKRHSALLKENSNHVPSEDTIFEAALEVWKDIPSCKIAQGYVLAYRIAKKVMESEGGNKFLSGARFHSDVRKDFDATDTGIKRKRYRALSGVKREREPPTNDVFALDGGDGNSTNNNDINQDSGWV